jgi:murein DD-endopeptidase MepM/ murein hydrolase activator NlpD
MTHKTPEAFEHELRDAVEAAQPSTAFVAQLEAQLTAQSAPRPTLWARVRARLAPRAGTGEWEQADDAAWDAAEPAHTKQVDVKPARRSGQKLVALFAALALVIGAGVLWTRLATSGDVIGANSRLSSFAMTDDTRLGGIVNRQLSPLASPIDPQGPPTAVALDPRSLNDCRNLPEPLAALGRDAPSPVALSLPFDNPLWVRSSRLSVHSIEGMPLTSPVDGTVWITRTETGDGGSHYVVAIVGTAIGGNQSLPWSYVLTWSHGALAVRNEQTIRAGDVIGYLGREQLLWIDFAYIAPTGPQIPDVLCVFPALRTLNDWSWLTIEDGDTWETIVQRSGMSTDDFFTLNPFLDGRPPQPGSFVRVRTNSAPTGTGQTAFVWPLDGIVTRPFLADHWALEIEGSPGAQIIATTDGFVSAVETTTQTTDITITIDHQGGTQTRYSSLSASVVQAGAQVGRGQVIGSIDGERAHLRFEMTRHARPIDPTRLFAPRPPESPGRPQYRYFVQAQSGISAFVTSAERYAEGSLIVSARFTNRTNQSTTIPNALPAQLDTGVGVLESASLGGMPLNPVLIEPHSDLVSPAQLRWRFEVGDATGPFTLTLLSHQFVLVPMDLPFDFSDLGSWQAMHVGDISQFTSVAMMAPGRSMRAVMDGTVIAVEPDSTGAFVDIRIQHDKNYVSSYKGLGKATVLVGTRVLLGEIVGITGRRADIPAADVYFELTNGEAPHGPTPAP